MVLGKYTTKDNEKHSKDDGEPLQNQQTSRTDKEQDAFNSGGENISKKSFHNEKRQQQHRKPNTNVSNYSSISGDISEPHSLYTNHNKKANNSVVLKNVHHLKDTDDIDSNQTDV